ncbi:MAG: deoxyribose-phosphate aldolase [Gaiellales bacterium]
MPPLDVETFARSVDHTLLDPTATATAVDEACEQALSHGFAAVCLYPWWVQRVRERLAGRVAVCTVISFPHGLDVTEAKVAATRRAVADGAGEIDVVMAHAAMRSGQVDAVAADLAAVLDAAGPALVKVIVEAGRLDGGELEQACRLVAASGAAFAKTSTGFYGGAEAETVARMRTLLPEHVQVKASGGIRSAAAAAAMLKAGATRLGTSSAVAILDELRSSAVA